MYVRHPGRRTAAALTVLAALGLVIVTSFGSASAAPGDTGTAGKTLAQVLDETGRAWLDAQAKLASSAQRQTELTAQLQRTEHDLAVVKEQVAGIAVAAYRTGGLSTASALLSSGSSDGFMDRATSINAVAKYNDRLLRQLNQLQKQQSAEKAAIDAEVTVQHQQIAELARKKQEAERALALAGGRATGGFVDATSPVAQPAPRNGDGSWPRESCIIDDPTTGGCLTARTVHALKQAQAAGFTRYVSCYRPGDQYEHPKGRACDFAAQSGGFGGVAVGGDRLYGNNLAAYFVRNASRLGVLYVIWFRQIWTPAAGWHSYGGGGGDPSSDHTNHVHLSLY